MSFGEKLRNARERRGLTQQQVADLMGIDKSTYCGYETGKRQPDVPKLKKLSKILGVSGDVLLETGYGQSFDCNVIRIAGRDGSYSEKHLTDDQLKALKLIIDQMPDAEDI